MLLFKTIEIYWIRSKIYCISRAAARSKTGQSEYQAKNRQLHQENNAPLLLLGKESSISPRLRKSEWSIFGWMYGWQASKSIHLAQNALMGKNMDQFFCKHSPNPPPVGFSQWSVLIQKQSRQSVRLSHPSRQWFVPSLPMKTAIKQTKRRTKSRNLLNGQSMPRY